MGLTVNPPKNLNQQHFYDYSIPLKSLEFDVQITGNISKTTLTQVYQNNYNETLECGFFFPMDNEVVMQKFECEFENKKVIGQIKEKEKAKSEYKQNKQEGNLVAYAEKSESQPDVMKIDLGNIEPNAKLTITFTYTQELKIAQNKFLTYKILQGVAPRYENDPSSYTSKSAIDQEFSKDLNNTQQIKEDDFNAYKTLIKLEITQETPINLINSPSHDLLILYQNDEKTNIRAQVGSEGQSIFGEANSKDFLLYFSAENLQIPRAILAENSQKRVCAQVTFVPDFNNAEMDDALRMQLQANENYEVDFESAKGEFIFLLDRSGSMSGAYIEQAKQALILFLKSLPHGSYFNVYSFGSRFYSEFEKSSNSEQKLAETIKKIEGFNTDMGGTQIYQPLEHILSQPLIKNHPRQIYLLTDGSVSSPQQVINLIDQRSRNSRVHSIGIGSGASTYLVNESAKKGRGQAVFVSGSGEIQGSIISLLEASLTPFLDDFQVKYDENIVESIVPNPKSIPSIQKNQPFNMFVFFKEGTSLEDINSQIEIECFDSKASSNLKYGVNINGKQNLRNNEVYNIGTHQKILALEDSLKFNKQYTDDVFYAKQVSAKDEIIRLSTENQILSGQTAFICVIKENSDEKKQQILNADQKKILVPQLLNQNAYDNSVMQNLSQTSSIKKKCKKASNFNSRNQGIYMSDMSQKQTSCLGIEKFEKEKMQKEECERKRGSPYELQRMREMEEQKRMMEEQERHKMQEQLQSRKRRSQQQPISQTKSLSMALNSRNSCLSKSSVVQKPSSAARTVQKNKMKPKLFDQADYFKEKQEEEEEKMSIESCSESGSDFSEDNDEDDDEDDNIIEQEMDEKQQSCVPKTSQNKKGIKKDKKEKKKVTKVSVMDILKLQNLQGFWDWDESIFCTVCKNTQEDYNKLLQETDQNNSYSQQVKITLLVLLWLQERQQDSKSSWNLIFKKAQQWLKKQQVDLNNYGSKFNHLLA